MSWPVRIATLSKGVRLFQQASAGWDFVRGTYKTAAGYVRTNRVTNPLMTGGVAGVLGSGGSLPTGWSYSTTITGLTYTVSYGSVGGRPYIDFRASGTAGGSSYLNLNFESASPSASNGQTWTNAADIALQAGSLTNISQSVMQINENTSGGAYVSSGSTGNLALTSTPARFWYTRTLSGGGTVGKALSIFTFNVAAAGAVDVTYRIFAPQMEQTAYPTSFLVGATTTFTSTNPADVGNMTFTRASTGYAEDAQGNLVLFGANVPRITNKGVLIEEARTNLLLQSVSLSPSWSYSAASLGGAITAPDGTSTAYLVQDTAATAQHAVYTGAAVTITAGATYTYSVYLKAGAYSTGQLLVANSSFANGFFVSFSLSGSGSLNSSGAAGTGTYTSSSITSVGNGWYRVTVSGIVGSSATSAVAAIYIGDTSNRAGVVGSGLYPWGAQLEAGSFPTSYIPTTSASVTRPADVFYYSGLSISMTSLTLASSTISTPSQSNSGRSVTLSGGVVDDFNIAVGSTTNIGQVAGSGLTITSVGPTLTTGAQNIVAANLAGASARGSGAGASVSSVTGSYSGVSTATTAVVGSNSVGTRPVNGYVQRLAIYPFAASDAQLQSISSGNF